MDDSVLVARAKSGDYEAFEQLVSRHERRLYALAMKIVRQREDAEDVVQTAFLDALEHLADFREEASFATWMTRIVTYAALKVLRKRKGLETVSLEEFTSENEEGEIPHPEYIADWRGDPAKIVEQRELKRILDEAIDALDEKYRLVFVLRDVEGMSVEETAKVLGITPANVKVRLLRARLMLREKLTRVFGDESQRVFRSHRHEGDERGATPAEALLKSYRQS
ncbi:MAG: sigma-70 family RNA polymerase sigma factor [Abditibacteriales bacterium]|nr:sigma-70 family RNA polymerase sigma factor [Abditibacteriales bacterium]MDW8366311.1 sigma-70 family RNA polymerase sigma factor [Abditibacteriales bacterium]